MRLLDFQYCCRPLDSPLKCVMTVHGNLSGKQIVDEIAVDDYVLDDTAIVYKSEKGIYIITGCSYSGICNII
ncbi:hypothetical protein CACET_c12840 [Clostridium aceticum]|uniref:Uncharacterized protein n=1 Tax=Clostridium aceticum TaxID=84022 RepID=A0A0G3WBD7_9CLOT|nr:hypothetical protein CACET_c12840 [Clostridium aceticum]